MSTLGTAPSTQTQPHLAIDSPESAGEQEADRVADLVMRTPEQQRQASVRSALSYSRAHETAPSSTQPIARSLLGAPGEPLPTATRAFFEPRFAADFTHVRVHTDARAQEAASSIDARAFTLGNNIAFARGEYSPHSSQGQSLLAHELTHVLQQGEASAPLVQREPKGGGKGKADEKESEKKNGPATSGSGATRYKQIRMRFDGNELIVYGDGQELFRYGASSGRPIPISEKDARECGGDPRLDTYMSSRFVGIEDQGPIPEGVFQFSAPQIQEFSTGEQLSLLWGGIAGRSSVTVQGQGIHPGDWGAGRVPLNKVRVDNAPCGNPHKRHSFFLHGGLMAGSSGCIDIGTSFDELADFLRGYAKPVTIEVKYETTRPRVGFFTGLGGAIAYKGGFHFKHGPVFGTGAEFAPDGSRAVLSGEYQAVLAWAGGALSAGLHLDVPMTSEEAFVRAGLRGGAEFRLLHALYGHLTVGGFVEPKRGEPTTIGLEVGGGLSFDFGPVQLKALYNHLQGAAKQDRDQVLLGLGFRW
jgi:hypothetical protein